MSDIDNKTILAKLANVSKDNKALRAKIKKLKAKIAHQSAAYKVLENDYNDIVSYAVKRFEIKC